MKTNLSLIKRLAIVSIFAFIVLLYGCTKPVEVSEVKVDKDKVSIAIDDEITINAIVLPVDAADKKVTWSSSDPTIATVSNGKIKGVKVGTATITAKAGEKTATINVTVFDPSVTVTFDTDGGSPVPSQKLVMGGEITFPDSPTKEGHTFIDWYKEGLTEIFDFLAPVNEDVTVYAKWEAITYNVTFKVGNVDDEVVTVNHGSKVTKPDDPVKNGYDFLGWYNGEVVFDFDTAIKENVVLVAKFKRGDSTEYTVEYDLQGGNFKYETKAKLIDELLVDYNKALSKTDTREKIAGYANWDNIDWLSFFFNAEYRDKWVWLTDYLGQVGSETNKGACAYVSVAKDVAQFNAKSANWAYALTYEVRAFILDIKYTKNTNWSSADYSDYELGNGFWPAFNAAKDKVKFEGLTEPFTPATVAYKEGYTFDGWYLDKDYTGEAVTEVNDTAKLYAKWEPVNPVQEIKIKNSVGTLEKGATLQLDYEVLPADAFNKKVEFSSSDEKILKVSDTGLITACNAGTATVTIRSVVRDVTATITITVLPQDDISLAYTNGFNGTLYPNGETKLTIAGVGNYKDSTFTFKSNNANVLTVDNNGNVKGVTKGVATIDISTNDKVLVTVTINVIEQPTTERIDQLLDLLTKANRPVVDTINASLFYDDYSSFQQYYDSTYGSVNYFLFDTLNLDTTSYLIDTNVIKNKTSGLKSSTEFITIHDTANISGGLVNHGKFWKDASHSTSIHFTVGDGGVLQNLDTKYIAHHAGDGTKVAFAWSDSGVKATGNAKPAFDIDTDGYITINGTKSNILAPKGKNDEILDKSYFTNLGPSWKIGENENYYLGNMHFDTSQIARGVIASYGGNLNSTGIEMCVNTNGNIYDTWQRTAKLVGKLLIEHELDTNRVFQHNNFTGKNCPQSLIMSDYWNQFMRMVELEYAIQTQFSDATITMKSNNPTLVNNKGIVIGAPKTAQAVTYELTVKIGDVTKTVTLGSVIPGTASWFQLDGFYSTKK